MGDHIMHGIFTAEKWAMLSDNLGKFAEGFAMTLFIVFFGLLLSLTLGILFGILSVGRLKILRAAARIYVEFFQNTPLLVQIFFLYNALPYLGAVMPVTLIGILGLGFYHGAYMSEVVRTGITAVPAGQSEAAVSQGFGHLEMMLLIILPQALKVMLPPLANVSSNLIKNTSILAVIAGGDLMYQADSFASSTLCYGPAYVTAGILYFIICFPLTRFSIFMEHRLTAVPEPRDYTALTDQYQNNKEER